MKFPLDVFLDQKKIPNSGHQKHLRLLKGEQLGKQTTECDEDEPTGGEGQNPKRKTERIAGRIKVEDSQRPEDGHQRNG